MKCPFCKAEIKENSSSCEYCGQPVNNTPAKIKPFSHEKVSTPIDNTISQNDKIPFYLQMWFIILIAILSSIIFSIPAIILFIVRLVKYPAKRKSSLLTVAGIIVAFFLVITIWYFIDTKAERTVQKLMNEGKFDEAIECIEQNYNTSSYSYYVAMAKAYEGKGDYNSAASYILQYVDSCEDLTSINDTITNMLTSYEGKVSDTTQAKINEELDTIKEAIELKEAEEKKAAEEKVAKEAADKAAKEAEEKKKAEEKIAKDTEKVEDNKSSAVAQTNDKSSTQTDYRSIVDGVFVSRNNLFAFRVMDLSGTWFIEKYKLTKPYVEAINSGELSQNKDGSYTLNYYTGDSLQLYFDGTNMVFDDKSEGTYVLKPNYELSFVPDEEEDNYDESSTNNGYENYEYVDSEIFLRNSSNYLNKNIALLVECSNMIGNTSSEYEAWPAYQKTITSGDTSITMWSSYAEEIVLLDKTGGSERWLAGDIMEIHGKVVGPKKYQTFTGQDTQILAIEVYESILIDKR